MNDSLVEKKWRRFDGRRIELPIKDAVREESEIYVSDCFENVASFTQGHVQMLAVCCVVFGLVLVATAVLAICLFHVVD